MKEPEKKQMGLLTFDSSYETLKAERLILAEDFLVEVIPTPKKISSSCGVSLLCYPDDVDKCLPVLKEHNIKIRGKHFIDFRKVKKRS